MATLCTKLIELIDNSIEWNLALAVRRPPEGGAT
jgi:hypothetical protein